MYPQKYCFHLLLLLCGLVPFAAVPIFSPQIGVVIAQTKTQPKSELILQAEKGLSLVQEEKLEEARQIFERTIQAAKQQGDRDAEALSMTGFGLIHSQQKQPKKALEVYQQALKMAEQGKFPTTKMTILMLIGREYYELQETEKALDLFQQILLVYQAQIEPWEKIWLLESIGNIHNESKQYKQAIESYQRIVAIYREIGENLEAANFMNKIGTIWRDLEDFPKAIQSHEQSLLLLKLVDKKQVTSKDIQTKESKFLINLANAYELFADSTQDSTKNQKYDKAIEYYKKAVPIYQKLAPAHDQAYLYGRIAEIYSKQLKHKESIDFYQKSLAIFQSLKDNLQVADTLNYIGLSWSNLGEYTKASSYYQQSLMALKLVDSKKVSIQDIKRKESLFLFNLAQAYSQLSKHKEALQTYQKLLAIFQDLKDNLQVADTLNFIGVAWTNLGEYPKAIEFYQQSLSVLKTVDDKQITLKDRQSNEALYLANLAYTYELLGDSPKKTLNAKYEHYEQAVGVYEKVLKINQDLNDSPGEASSLERIAILYRKLSKHNESIKFYQKALAIFKNLKDAIKVANTLNSIGVSWYYLNEYSQAIEFYQQALLVLKTVDNKAISLKEIRRQESQFLINIAYAYQQWGKSTRNATRDAKYNNSLQFYQQSITIYQEIDDQPGEASVLLNIAKFYTEEGKHQEAIEFYQKALTIFRNLKNNTELANTLYEIGVAWDKLGKFDKTVEYFEEIVTLRKSLKDDKGTAESLIKIGKFYSLTHNYVISPKSYISRNLKAYQEAFKIYYKLNDMTGQMNALYFIKAAYISQKQYFNALEIHRYLSMNKMGRKLNITEVINPSINNNYDSLIELKNSSQNTRLIENDNLIKSLPNSSISLIASLLVAVDYGDAQISALSVNYLDLSRTYLTKQRKINKTVNIDFNKQVFLRWQQIILANVLEYIYYNIRSSLSEHDDKYILGIRASQPLLSVGLIYLQQGETNAAIDYYQRALTISQELGDRALQGNILTYQGLMYELLEQPNKALNFHEKALLLLKETGDSYAVEKTLEQQGRILLKTGRYAASEKAFLDAIKLWEGSRAYRKEHLINANLGIDVAFLYYTRENIYHYLQRALIEQGKNKEALEISQRSRSQTLGEILINRKIISNNQEPKQKISFESPNLTQIQEIAKAQNATIVQYSLIPDIDKPQDSLLYIWVIQPNGKIDFRSIDLAKLKLPLSDLITISRNVIGARGRSDVEIVAKINPQEQKTRLQELHKLLIEPIENFLPQNPQARVIFIPQGDLFLTPFAALQDAKGKYLIEKHTIFTSSSIQVLDFASKSRQKTRSKSWNANDALIVGNPTMPNLSKINPTFKSIRIDPLPVSETEAIAIAKQLKTQALIGSQATESEVVRRMKTARLIHLATHGLITNMRGTTPQLGSIPGAIVLASSGDEESNDGLLTAEEIYKIDLNADLV
ncbi:MAG: tetratricopeptide repeat protein, partial [Nostocales cyanobacterium 94392]|nr:tetratricopeptide repeat protein [Nostocales cyanobacterium 94392]